VNQETGDPQSPRPFRVCEQCRALTPVNLPHCVACGALSVQAMVQQQQVQEEQRFIFAIIDRPISITYAILFLNVLIYLLMVLAAGGSYLNNFLYMNDIGTLIAFGAKTNQLLREGEIFRLITPIFIHGGLLHLASNSYAIWTIGPLVEKLYGSSRFYLIYLLSGIGGVVGSYIGGLSRPAGIPGVGASGAIFGLFGVLLVFGYRYRDELPPNFRQSIRSGILPVILINLMIGFSIPSIDNGAHIGGLLTGAALVFLVPYLAPGRKRDSRAGQVLLLLCLILTFASFVKTWQVREPHLHRRVVEVSAFLDSLQAADDLAIAIFREVALNGQPPADAETRVNAALARLESQPGPDPMAEACRKQLLEVLEGVRHLLPMRSELLSSSEWQAIGDRILEAREEKLAWVRREGEQYGFRIKTAPAEKSSTPDSATDNNQPSQ
jgi:membrane associated rhomboid family serine protease